MTRIFRTFISASLICGSLMYILFQAFEEQKDVSELKHMQDHLSSISKYSHSPKKLNFCGERVPLENPSVQQRFEKEITRKVYNQTEISIYLKRAHRFRPIILPILRRHEIPEDMFYLAVAESALSQAQSPKGAKGMWQFMRSTALEQNLEVSETVDERFHVIKATHAACRFLNEAYATFGNWTLVAAAYNMGQTGVQKALDRQEVESYYDLALNKETSKYVFRILAIKFLMEEYGSNKKIHHSKNSSTLKIQEDIEDLQAFALALETDLPTLKEENPWLISSSLIVKPGKIYEIRIPKHAKEVH